MCETLQNLREELKEIEHDCPSSTLKTEYYEHVEASLCNLPVEIIINICKYLDLEFIRYTLGKVCKRFDDIFNDTALWKMWVKEKVKNKFPPLEHLKVWEEKEFDWETAAVEISREERKWANVEKNMRHIVASKVHYASVDTITLVNGGQISVSGGRDRSMALWRVMDMPAYDESAEPASEAAAASKPAQMRLNAHNGWVWDLAPDDRNNAKVIYSASWDNSIKAWDIEAGFTDIAQFPCGMSALSVIYTDHTVLAGLYNKKIMSFDPRAGIEPISEYKPHKGPVLDLESYGNMVASVSEDRTLAIYDRVAGKIMAKDIKMPMGMGFPVCISWSEVALYVGDSKGRLHVIDPETYKYLKTHIIYELPDENIRCATKITMCTQRVGYMIASSDHGHISFYYNSYPPKEFVTVKSTTKDITQMHYVDGVLAIGTCESAVEFWVPVEKYDE